VNYYERHLGDYAKDTAHLTMLEHGAYTLLLDRYYATEAGIPGDQAHRVARARSKEEKAAVDVVLNEFFILSEGVWVKGRVDKEIAKAQTKMKAAQENGLKGGRPRKTQDKPGGLSVGYETETQEKAHQTPDTSHQTPLKPEVIHTESITHPEYVELADQARVIPIKPGLAGACCKTMMSNGIHGCNPHHPTLLALLEAGATEDEFAYAARNAASKGNAKFAYVLGTVKRQREEAAKLVLHHGRLPNKQEALEESNRAATAGWMPPELRETQHAN